MKTVIIPKLSISALAMAAMLIPASSAVFAQGMGTQTKPMGGSQAGSMGQSGQDTQQQPAQKPTANPEDVAANKVKDAKDANTALQAATDYAKTYPNGKARSEIVDVVVGKIKTVQDPVQRATLSEKLMNAFGNVDESDGIFEMLIDSKQNDDAFRLGAERLAKTPNELRILTDLANAGRDEIKVNNIKHQTVIVDYGKKAIEIIETGNKPVAMDDAEWNIYKTKMLPALYQTIGMIDYSNKDRTSAQKMFMKAMSLDATNALTYVMLADISDDQYQDVANKIKAATDQKQKEDMFPRAINLLDQTIDLYLHAAAYSDGDTNLAPIHEHAMKSLDTYYPFRHNGSKTGMQADIDKLKKPAVNP